MMRAITIIGFCVCGALAIVLLWTAHRDPDRTAGFGALLDEVMVSRPVRVTLVVFWWWLGWHFIAEVPVGL